MKWYGNVCKRNTMICKEFLLDHIFKFISIENLTKGV